MRSADRYRRPAPGRLRPRANPPAHRLRAGQPRFAHAPNRSKGAVCSQASGLVEDFGSARTRVSIVALTHARRLEGRSLDRSARPAENACWGARAILREKPTLLPYRASQCRRGAGPRKQGAEIDSGKSDASAFARAHISDSSTPSSLQNSIHSVLKSYNEPNSRHLSRKFSSGASR